MEPPIAATPVVRARRFPPRWLKRAAFESLLIVVSLVLAFALNEWREAHNQKAQLREARALIAEEISHNRATLEAPDYLQHHQQLLERYRRLAESTDPRGDPIFDTGVHIAPLRDAAWRSLSAREIVAQMPYREIVLLADLYQEQTRLENMHWTVMSLLIAPQPDQADTEQLRARKHSIALYLGDVVSTERRLLKRYSDGVGMLASD